MYSKLHLWIYWMQYTAGMCVVPLSSENIFYPFATKKLSLMYEKM